MPFKTMDPEDAWKAIEGFTNELAPEQKALDAFYRQFVCPKCKNRCRREISPSHAFGGDNLVGRALLRCETCNYLFDPHTGISVELGNL